MPYKTLQSLIEARKKRLILPEGEALTWAEHHAPKQLALAKKTGFYSFFRGSSNDYSGSTIVSRTSYRSAMAVGDLYKKLLDEANPSWPSRGFSTICSTNPHTADNFGTVIAILPPDDAVCGILPVDDLHGTDALYRTNWEVEAAAKRAMEIMGCEDESIQDAVAAMIHLGDDEESDFDTSRPMTVEYINSTMNEVIKRVKRALHQEDMGYEAASKALTDELTRRMGKARSGYVIPAAGFEWIIGQVGGSISQPFVTFAKKHSAYKWDTYKAEKKTAFAIASSREYSDNEVWFEGPHLRIAL